MKSKLVKLLSANDGLKPHERGLFAEYLDVIFSAAESAAPADKLSDVEARWQEMLKSGKSKQ